MIASIAGCGSPSPNSAADPATRLPIPTGLYSGVAWLPEGLIVVEYSPRLAQGSGSQLWTLRPDGSAFERIPLTADAACRRTEYSHPTVLPDGNLGFVKWCFGNGVRQFLESYTRDSGKEMPLALLELPFNPHRFTFDPDMRSGFISTLSDICGTIAAFNSKRIQPLPISITDNGHSWRLDDYFRRDPARSCSNEGRADWPTLSADGSRLAFLASGPVPGVRDFARLDLPWSIFVTDRTDFAPQAVLSGVRHPRGLAWSPNGRWLAFAGQVDGRGAGTWLFDPTSHRVVRIADKSLDELAWSPDGQQIVGVFNPNPAQWPPRDQVLVLDVATTVSL
jgi:WD40 repeat protein